MLWWGKPIDVRPSRHRPWDYPGVDWVHIAIDDAAVAPLELGERTGLGTRIFNLVSDGRWGLTREDASTIFRLVMCIQA